MGTAGPLALARELLDDGSGEPFFVLNRWALAESGRRSTDIRHCHPRRPAPLPTRAHSSHSPIHPLPPSPPPHPPTPPLPPPPSDVVCEYPLQDFLEFHKERGGEATILVTKVRPAARLGTLGRPGRPGGTRLTGAAALPRAAA
jgi:hypothetical protein